MGAASVASNALGRVWFAEALQNAANGVSRRAIWDVCVKGIILYFGVASLL